MSIVRVAFAVVAVLIVVSGVIGILARAKVSKSPSKAQLLGASFRIVAGVGLLVVAAFAH
jgi:hypothetical protein